MNLKAHLIVVSSIAVVVGTIYVFDRHPMVFTAVGGGLLYWFCYHLTASIIADYKRGNNEEP